MMGQISKAARWIGSKSPLLIPIGMLGALGGEIINGCTTRKLDSWFADRTPQVSRYQGPEVLGDKKPVVYDNGVIGMGETVGFKCVDVDRDGKVDYYTTLFNGDDDKLWSDEEKSPQWYSKKLFDVEYDRRFTIRPSGVDFFEEDSPIGKRINRDYQLMRANGTLYDKANWKGSRPDRNLKVPGITISRLLTGNKVD